MSRDRHLASPKSPNANAIGTGKALFRKAATTVLSQNRFDLVYFDGVRIFILGGMPNGTALSQSDLDTLKAIILPLAELPKEPKPEHPEELEPELSPNPDESIIDEKDSEFKRRQSLLKKAHISNDFLTALEKLMVGPEEVSKCFIDFRTEDEWRKEWGRDPSFQNVETHKIPIPDHAAFEDTIEAPETLKAIAKGLEIMDRTKIVYLNCRAGVGRSYCMVLTWLMTRLDLPLAKAHRWIQILRPQVDPNVLQILKVCEFVFRHQKEKYLNHPPGEKSGDRLMNTFYDFCKSTMARYKSVLQKGNPAEFGALVGDLKTLMVEARFMLEELSQANGFTPEDAEKLHNNLSAIFRMRLGILAAYSNYLPKDKTALDSIQRLADNLQNASEDNPFLKIGEARAQCTALISEIYQFQESIDPAKKEIEMLENKVALLKEEIQTGRLNIQKTEKEIKSLQARIEKLQEESQKKSQASSEEDSILVKWGTLLQTPLEDLKALKERPDISHELVEDIQKRMLDIVSLETHVLLLTVNPGDNLPDLQTLSANNANKPILIREGENISLFGMTREKKWKITPLDPAAFVNLPFPQAGKVGELKNYDSDLTHQMKKEIKKGHDPDYAGNRFFDLIRRFREAIRKIFDTNVHLSTHFTKRILQTDRSLLTQVCHYTFFSVRKDTTLVASSSSDTQSAAETDTERSHALGHGKQEASH